MRNWYVWLLAACLMMPAGANAQKKTAKAKVAVTAERAIDYKTLPQGVRKGASVEGITEYFLDNGLQVLLFPDPSKQTVTVNITYKVGSRHEGYGETGMAHLLEHLVFKGTPRHPDIPNELTKHGARPNGTTWYDRTNYFETFAATEENLRWALDLEADRMVNSFIAKKDLDSEMTVVRNEFEMGENDPTSILMERIMSTAYLWHNYGKSTIGARADIENVPIERLQAFYRKYYQPDNAVLMVAGKIDPDKTLWMVSEYFSRIPRPDRTLYPTYTAEPVQDGERQVTLRRVGDVQAIGCLYHIPPGSHPDAAAVDILVDLMTQEPSGRLYKALVESKKASNQFGWCATLKEPGFAYFGAQVRKESDARAAIDTMMQTLDAISTLPPTAEEVERAKNKQIKNFELFTRNTESVGRAISEYIGMGDWRLAFIYRDNIRKVTPEDVQRVALAYFKPSNRTTGIFFPEEKPNRAEVPAAPDVEALVRDYKGDALVAQGEDFDPSCTNIEARTHRGEAGDLRYAFLPKATKGNLVQATLTLRFGNEQNLNGKATISSFVANMLDRGTETKSRQEIKDAFDKLKAQVRIFGGSGTVTAAIQTTRENLPAVLSLVNEILRKPSFNEKDFEELRNEELAGIEEQQSDPTALVQNAFARHLNPYPKGDIRYNNSIEEELEAVKTVKLEDCRAFHRKYYGAGNATFAIVGDFDEAAIKNQMTAELGGWESDVPYARVPEKYAEVAPVNINIETPDKANAMFLAGLNLPLRDDDPDYPALMLGNYILGGGFLNSRLAARIRQKEGISYGVGSQFFADEEDRNGGFLGYAIFAPENRDRLEAAFREEIDRVLKEGYTPQEVEDARNGFLQSRKVNRSQDNALASALNRMLPMNRTFRFIDDLENKMASLTPEQIHAAMRRHIDPARMSFFKGGDFANKLKKP
ncbi:MAG: hypothetical protein JPMHGGIA_01445 [Saprospiraceae bacterium]|nr:hypothetical protein [Saprospiraceae bacterium]